MNKLLQEPAGLKQIAKRLETQLKGKGVASVGTGYALLNRLDPPEKARWALFVYAANPDAVKVDQEYEGYPVQVRGVPKAF